MSTSVTEILSEADIINLQVELTASENGLYGLGYRGKQMQRALNTIKLQRQQLAEQDRKVWNEAIHKCLDQQFLARYSYQFLSDPDGEEKRGAIILVEYLEKLLKPESEASGENS